MRACAAGSLPPSPLPVSAAGANDGAVGTGIDAARLHLASPAPEGGEAPSLSGAALGGLTAAFAAPGRLPHVRLSDLTALWATGAADHVGAPLIEFYEPGHGEHDYLSNFARHLIVPFTIPPRCRSAAFLASGRSPTLSMEFAEKGIMACKAALMGDLSTLSAIASASDPHLAKRLGRQVAPWDQPSWDAVVCEVAVAVLQAKFSGVPFFGDRLVGTGRSVLAEAAPRDLIWGTGSPRGSGALPSAWRGHNLLGWALMRVRDTLRDQRRTAGLRAGEAALHTPRGDAALATPVDMLHPAMRPLARSLLPTEAIFDRGGGGCCGPNSLAYLLLPLGRSCGDGHVLRAEVIAHARQCLAARPPLTLTEVTCGGAGDVDGAGASLATHLTESMRAWPAHARCGLPASADSWVELMARPATWIDEPFLRLCAHLKEVEIEYRAVTADGARARGGVIRPPPPCVATARVVLALWVQQHYAAILRVADSPAPAPVDLLGGDASAGFTTQGLDLWLVPAASHSAATGAEGWGAPAAKKNSSLPATLTRPDPPGPPSQPLRGESARRPPAKRAHPGGAIRSNAGEALRSMLRRKASEGVALTASQRAAEEALARWDEGAPTPEDTALLAFFRLPKASAPQPTLSAGQPRPVCAGELPPVKDGLDNAAEYRPKGSDSPSATRPADPVPQDEYIGAVKRRRDGASLDGDEVTLSRAISRGVTGMPPQVARGGGSGRRGHPPLTDLTQVLALLDGPNPPTVLVGMEFSGAVRSALEALGLVALSVDFRPSLDGGLHYQGDVRDVLALRPGHWQALYFFPNCFQQLRADVGCLPLKLQDGRAFWGCAMVLWCVCQSAPLVVVEQPDTIVYDLCRPAHTRLYEFRTEALGDSADKFVRLAVRGVGPVCFDPNGRGLRARPQPGRTQFDYANPDARDRARSAWTEFPKTASQLAALAVLPHVHEPAPIYSREVDHLRAAFLARGYHVPSAYAAPDAQPPDSPSRKYQTVRGQGHGPPPTARDAAGDDLRGGDSAGEEAAALGPRGAAGAEHSLANVDGPRPMSPRPGANGPDGHGLAAIDLRSAAEAASVLIFVCVVGQPLVYAHVNGYSVYGVSMPLRESRPACMTAIQALVRMMAGALCFAYMVGEYLAGLRLFAAPIAARPAPAAVIRDPQSRLRASRAGAAFMWMTLCALRGCPVEDAAARAILSAETFAGPTQQLADSRLGAQGHSAGRSFLFGKTPPEYLLTRPPLSAGLGPPSWRALAQLVSADSELMSALGEAAWDNLLSGWREAIRPIDTGEIPPGLLANLPSFDDERLDLVPLSLVPEPASTPWLPRPPLQRAVEGHCPRSVGDLMPESTRQRAYDWLQLNLDDLLAMQRAALAGESLAERRRPSPLAIGQEELHPWARGVVWDCRPPTRALHEGCCVVADFHAPFESDLNLELFRRRLHGYPDQTLVANLLEGARLDADVELQSVLVPHLTSLPKGFASVEKELRRLHAKGWYDFFSDFPFWPMYLNGQGSAARKLEPDRHRRITEGGGPRQPTFDKSGLRALSLNEASHIWHVPRYFADDPRPAMASWLAARGLPASPHAELGARRTKWPKELKPRLNDVMRDMAVLRRAAHVLGEPIYIFGDDVKDYFNQLAMAPSELWKLGVVFLRQGESLEPPPRYAAGVGDARLIFVSEKRLGFGTHGASNLCQRWANAKLDLYRDEMDEAESQETPTPAAERWRAARVKAQHATGQPCVPTRRYEDFGAGSAPTTTFVCAQHRLYAVHMYTDDPVFIVVGVQRALRALRLWRRLTDEMGLVMAIAEKRSLGSWTLWIGVLLIPALGIVVVPRSKLLRAARAIDALLASGLEFHEYRSLCGLLEHLRAVNLRGRNVMHGLYVPHGPDGASRDGPSGWVTCDLLMRKQLERWNRLIWNSGGTSVRAALEREELEDEPELYLVLDSDAMRETGESGIGGYFYGLYWYYPVPEDFLPDLTIPVLEFLGVCLNLLVFAPTLLRALKANRNAYVVLRTDALTTARTLPAESQKNPLMVSAYQWLLAQPWYQELAPRVIVAHLYGDANPFADCVSRARWTEFATRCRQVGVVPEEVHLPPAAQGLVSRLAALARLTALRAGCLPSERGATASRAPYAEASGAARVPRRLAARLESIDPGAHPGLQPPPGPRARLDLKRPSDQSAGASWERRDASWGWRPMAAPRMAADVEPAERAGGRAPETPTSPEARLPVAQRRSSQLAEADRRVTRERVLGLASAGSDARMHLRAAPSALFRSAERTSALAASGVNAATLKVDERAWEFWVNVCESQGTTPLRSSAEARDQPDRNAHLLACLMMYAHVWCIPRTRDAQFIKPRSALAYPLAICRIFKRWGVQMPGYRALAAAFAGLMRSYLAHHGPGSLAPRRAEPMKFSMMRDIYRAAPTVRVAGRVWSDDCHDVFIFRRLNVFLMYTAFRLGETTGPDPFLTLTHLVWSIRGTIVTDPTAAQLHSLRPGMDYAQVAPPLSKADQWGERNCPFMVTLTYSEEPENPAAQLRDLELRCRGSGPRSARALFPNAAGEPYAHATLCHLLKGILTFLYSEAVASVYTFHSYRSGLATALHAAGVPDATIQLICRWMCPESLHAYRRMGTREHERLTAAAARADVHSLQRPNVVRVAGDQGYAELAEAVCGRQGAAAQREYDGALGALAEGGLGRAEGAPTPHLGLTDPRGGPLPPQLPPRRPPGTPNRSGRREPRAPALAPGDEVHVDRDVWPTYPCEENGGTAWTARVLRVEEGDCLLAFPHSRAASGLAFADEWLSCAAVHRSPRQPSRRSGPSLADLRRARPAEREAGPECPSNVGGTSASHRTTPSPGAASAPTPRAARRVRLAVLLACCRAVVGMGAPRQASPPLPGPASWLAPVVLLALVAIALAAAIRLAATTANDGDSDAPTAARAVSPPPSPPPALTDAAPFPGVTSEHFPNRRRVYRQTMYHRVHDDREVGRLLLWYPGALKRMTCVLMTDDASDAPFGLSAELDRVTAVVVGYNGRLSRNVAILPDGRYIFPRCRQLTASVAAEVLSDDEARHVLRAAVRRYGCHGLPLKWVPSPGDEDCRRWGHRGFHDSRYIERTTAPSPPTEDKERGGPNSSDYDSDYDDPPHTRVSYGWGAPFSWLWTWGDGRGNWNGPPHGFMNGGWATHPCAPEPVVRGNRERGAEPVLPMNRPDWLEPGPAPDWGQAPYALGSRLTADALSAHDAARAAGREPPSPTGSDFQLPGTRRWYPASNSSDQSRISRPETPPDGGAPLEPGMVRSVYVFGSAAGHRTDFSPPSTTDYAGSTDDPTGLGT